MWHHVSLPENYFEPEDLSERIRTLYKLNNWKVLKEKLEKIDSSSEEKCEDDSDRCRSLRSMETSIKDGWVYNAISRCKNIIGDPDCACGSEASLVRNMARDVEENIDRINAEDCGSCGMCGDCSIEELTKESEVRQHEYTCQQRGYEAVWASTYKELEHCQGKKHR